MVRLATARDIRMYGPRLVRNRWEYINAGLYVFATILLTGGFASQLSGGDAKSGLVVILIALAIITLVNGHDLVAHMAGIDYRFSLVGFDMQLALVEFAVPLVYILGSVFTFIGVLLLFIQREKGYYSYRLEKHALNTLIAGPLLWVVGSIHNACQVYERADGHVQILQKSVQIPFLMGSLLFLVGGIFNWHEVFGFIHRDFEVMGKSWVWLAIFGSLLFLIGGLMNVVKVFKMQQMDGVRLEKLRGGAHERLSMLREGQAPLIIPEDNRRRKQQAEESSPVPVPTSYKDALVGEA